MERIFWGKRSTSKQILVPRHKQRGRRKKSGTGPRMKRARMKSALVLESLGVKRGFQEIGIPGM